VERDILGPGQSVRVVRLCGNPRPEPHRPCAARARVCSYMLWERVPSQPGCARKKDSYTAKIFTWGERMRVCVGIA
jgi:hypothetical protein